MAEQYISVGKLGKPHGISGAFRFLLHRELKSKQKLPNHFMIEEKGSFLPWFVREVEWLGFGVGFIAFEEISSPEQAKRYSTHELFVSQKAVDKWFKRTAENLDYMLGFRVFDENKGDLGVVKEIAENPGQILFTINEGDREILIPFVEEFVSSINKRKKEIIFDLPDGLLDL